MSSNQDDHDVATVKARTAELLGLSEEERGYITPELLAMEAKDVMTMSPAEWGDEYEEPTATGRGIAAVVPNRIWFISEIVPGFNGSRTNITFFRNCDRRIRYVMWSDQYNRYEREGWCGVGGGRYEVRSKLWWRQ